MKKLFLPLFLAITCLSINKAQAQKKFDSYALTDSITINAGDTVTFLEGSFGGNFVYVKKVMHLFPKTITPFIGEYDQLVVSYFIRKKEKGKEIIYLVMEIPNLKKIYIYADVHNALKTKEISIQSK